MKRLLLVFLLFVGGITEGCISVRENDDSRLQPIGRHAELDPLILPWIFLDVDLPEKMAGVSKEE